MNTISIPVDPEIQAAFEQASEAERQALGQLIRLLWKEGWASKNLIQVMQEIGSRAEQRGLTPDLLSELLKADSKADPTLQSDQETWQSVVRGLAGAWADFPTIDEIRSGFPQDISRESI